MIDVKIDLGKLLASLHGSPAQPEPSGPPAQEAAPQPQGAASPSLPDIEQAPINPIVMTAMKANAQLADEWSRIFTFLS